jgi:hypothetical protein
VRRWLWLAAVLAASLAGQLAILHGGIHPLIFPDSLEYLAQASVGHGFGRFFDTKRTPGYPVFLGLVALVNNTPAAIVVAQVLIVLLTNALAFAITARLSGSIVAGTVGAVLVAANPWFSQWEQAILTEALATMLLLVVAGLWVRFEANPSWKRGALLGGACAALVVVRPAFVLAGAALALPGLWSSATRGDRQLAAAMAVMLVTAYLPVAGYAAGNAATNGYTGISTTSNVDVFGATYLDFGLFPTSAPAACEALVPLVRAERGEDPYAFLARHPQFNSANQALVRDCGYAAIRERPLAFLVDVTVRFATLPVQSPVFYYDNPHVDTQQFKRPVLLFRGFRAWIVLAYIVAAAGYGVQLARRRTGPVITGLALLVVAGLVTIAAIGPTELYRLRSPLDPLATILAVAFCCSWLRGWRSPVPGRRDAGSPAKGHDL